VVTHILDSVDYSTDEDIFGRPSTSEGKSAAFHYSILKRAADDDDAGPSGTSSEFVNTHTEASDNTRYFITKSLCLSQDEIFVDDSSTQSHAHIHAKDTQRKRFAREQIEKAELVENVNNTKKTTFMQERRPPPIDHQS